MLYTERDLEIPMVGNGLIETTPALSEHSWERGRRRGWINLELSTVIYRGIAKSACYSPFTLSSSATTTVASVLSENSPNSSSCFVISSLPRTLL